MNQSQVCMCPPTSWTPIPTSLPTLNLQNTGFGCPASYIKLTLVICFAYGNVHVSMLVSQIILLAPSPTEYKSLFFTSVSPLLPCLENHRYHLSRFHTSAFSNALFLKIHAVYLHANYNSVMLLKIHDLISYLVLGAGHLLVISFHRGRNRRTQRGSWLARV